MIWQIVKALLLLLLAGILFKFAKLYKMQRRLEKQGVVFSKWFPIVTDTFRVIYYTTKYPYDLFLVKMVQMGHDGKIPDKVGFFFMGLPIISFNTADALDEIYVTKNAFYSKHEITRTN